MINRFVVMARKLSGKIEFADLGATATVSYEGQSSSVDGHRAGSALWKAMKAGGVNPQGVNSFTVCEDTDDQTSVAHMHAVLDGARVVWLVLYRADRVASCFKPIGSRQRIVDAFDVCFHQVVKDIRLPHKP